MKFMDNRRQFIKKSLLLTSASLLAPTLLAKAKQTWEDCPATIYYPDSWYKYSEVFNDFYYAKIRNGKFATLLILRGNGENSDMLIDLTQANNAYIFCWQKFYGRNEIKIMIKNINLQHLPKKISYHTSYGLTSYSYPIKVEFEMEHLGYLFNSGAVVKA